MTLARTLLSRGYDVNGVTTGRADVTSSRSGAGRDRRQESEVLMGLMELKEKTTLSREEAAKRLHAIADELASNNDVVLERQDLRFVARVPDQVHLKVEFEIEDDGTELEIELTW
jgi:amphi-Trp domain-containing protein